MWIGDRLSLLENLSIMSFLTKGHEYHLYTYGDVQNVPQGTVILDGNTILPKEEIFVYKRGEGKGSVSAFSNLFRYKLLLDKGGWWIDTDVYCLKRFDFKEEYVFGYEGTRSSKSLVASCVMKVPVNSSFSKMCYDFSLSCDRDKLKWCQIGPDLVTDTVNKLGLEGYVKSTKIFCPVDWWDVKTHIVGNLGSKIDLQDSFAIHLWNEMWRRHSLDKSKYHDPRSIFNRLGLKLLI